MFFLFSSQSRLFPTSRCAPGYTRNTKQDGRQCIPIGDVKSDRVEFIPSPDGEPQHRSPGHRRRPRRRRVRIRSRLVRRQ